MLILLRRLEDLHSEQVYLKELRHDSEEDEDSEPEEQQQPEGAQEEEKEGKTAAASISNIAQASTTSPEKRWQRRLVMTMRKPRPKSHRKRKGEPCRKLRSGESLKSA